MFALFAAASLTLVAFGGFATGTLNSLGFPVSPFYFGAAGTILSIAVVAVKRPHTLGGLVPPVLLWLTMIAGFVYSTRSTEYGEQKVQYLFTLTPLMVIGAILLLAIPEVRSRLVLCIVAWGAFIALLQYLFPAEDGNMLTMSAEGSSYQNFGRAVAAAAVALLILAARRRKSSIPYLVFGLLFLWLAFSSGSRGPALAATLAIAVGVLASRIPPLATIATVFGGFLVVQFVDIQQHLPARFQSFDDNSVRDRRIMLDIAADQFAAAPMGVGWAGLEPTLEALRFQMYYVHNIFVEVAVEAGIVGLIGLLAYVGYAFLGQYRATTSGVESALLGLAVFWTGIATVSGDFNSNRGFHLMMGAGIAAWTIHRWQQAVAHDVNQPESENDTATISRAKLASGRWA